MPCFQAIEKKYDISGIPTLIVVRKSDGGIITMEGVEAIEEKGNQVFTIFFIINTNISVTIVSRVLKIINVIEKLQL